ncbi:hypothetical protein RRF57_000307 [Xylaria bambusicola]|uniref:Uncharacterized protein n=1 Tax=Xylaria bambusicola TaxID=326684 RepID=A0AAN7Z5H7_9PEZI
MEKIVSKGLMMGAAITFTAIHREHTLYNYVTLGIFSLGTAAHVVMSLRVTNLALDGANSCSAIYLLIAMPFLSALAAAAVCLPQFIPALGYTPVIIAFALWMIEDCSNLHPEVCCLLSWWPWTMHHDVARSAAAESTVGIHGSIGPDYRVDDDDDDDDESLLLRYMWSPNQSCVPSSRLSDISLSPSGLDSLPSSWGTLTRNWFPEFSTQGEDLCRRSLTV